MRRVRRSFAKRNRRSQRIVSILSIAFPDFKFFFFVPFYRAKKEIPPYLQRSSFVPVDLDDFGDGGAYPEIHVIQYPLNMGKPGVKSTAVITVDVDENGQVRYDAIVKQGTNKNKIVQTSLSDLKEKAGDQDVV